VHRADWLAASQTGIDEATMLTDAQLFHFRTFGFLVFRQLFRADELRTIRAEFDLAMEAAYRHMPFDGTRRHWLPLMGPTTPFFAGLLEDPRFYEPARQMYGDDVLGVVSDGNRYVGNTKWHPDTASIHQYGVKFAYYLEPVGAESGALRVIPGSHRNPWHDELRAGLRESGLDFGDVPACVCASEPGDVVAFDLRLWHGSHGGSSDRRMCTLVYYNNPRTPEEETATRSQAAGNAQTPARYHRPDEPIYDPHWISNPAGSPVRGRWIERLRELGFFGTPSVAA